MKYVLLLGLQALVFCGAGGGVGADSTVAPAPDSFRQQVLSALGAHLLQPEPLSTRAFVRGLMKRTGVGGSDVRNGMLDLLDSLDAERKGKSEKWERIRKSGGTQVKPKQVEKLLKELTKRTRKALKKNEDKTLGSLLKHGAKKAGLPDYRARAVLLRALEVSTDSAAVFLGFPARVGISLEVTTPVVAWTKAAMLEAQIAARHGGSNIMIPLPVTDDSPAAQGILSSLAQRLEESQRVAWVSSQSAKPVKPDCRLVFAIRELSLRSHASIVEGGSGEPLLDAARGLHLEARLTMEDVATGIEVHRDEITVRENYAWGRNLVLPGQEFMDKFCQETALAAIESVEAYLAR